MGRNDMIFIATKESFSNLKIPFYKIAEAYLYLSRIITGHAVNTYRNNLEQRMWKYDEDFKTIKEDCLYINRLWS